MQMLLQNVDIVKKGVAGISISYNTVHTNTNTNTNANTNTSTSINTDTNTNGDRKSSELYWPLPYFCQKKFLCRAHCLHKNGRGSAAVKINWNQ